MVGDRLWWWHIQGFCRSGKTGKSQGICVVREKYYVWKVMENDLGLCRLQISVIFLRLQILKRRQICGFHWTSKS